MLEEALGAVTDPAVRRAVILAAHGVARADGTVEAEEAVIAAARAAWHIEAKHLGLVDDLIAQAKRDFAAGDDVEAIEDPEVRAEAVERMVQSRAIGLALLALPPPNLVTESLGAFFQIRLVRAIGRMHGHAGDSDMTKALVGSLFGVVALHAGLGALVRMVPVWGSAVGAAASYATTYGIGYAANAYFEADGVLDDEALKTAFRSFRTVGRESFDKKDLESRWAGRKTDISELSRRFLHGQISAEEVAFKVREDLGEES